MSAEFYRAFDIGLVTKLTILAFCQGTPENVSKFIAPFFNSSHAAGDIQRLAGDPCRVG
jgi:hypothetical protein